MKVIQVVPTINNECAGPSYSVPGLSRGLVHAGCEVELHCVGEIPQKHFEYPVVSSSTYPFPFSYFHYSPQFYKRIKAAAISADIIHNNSFWLLTNVYPGKAVMALPPHQRPKLINAPRGTFAQCALKRHAIRKKLFGHLCGQYAVMAATDMWHATCEKEYFEIRQLGYRQPVAIVPIGMDLPGIRSEPESLHEKPYKRIVFFGRLHKIKAIDHLVTAWGRISESLPQATEWELIIAGPDCGVKTELEKQIAENAIPRVSFVGELNGPAKYKFLSEGDLYVLPSYTENFGVTLAEALACGLPSIASQGTPWQGLEANRAGKWVPVGADALTVALREMLLLGDERRRQMGANGRAWIQRDFSWDGIGSKMKTAYEWLLGRADKPDWVITD